MQNVKDIYELFFNCGNLRTITMKGCDEVTAYRIEILLTNAGIRDNVTIVRE